ncbi:ArsR family transcriptional regulator [Rhodococcus sp. B50]|uniref:ArsR family transcriptional regulator n=1 Tax=Rhodococcus sp. B50 TaxID=2682847 RepID=UPI001BD28D64|nr:ArsR family transcriptional regulator [Rhodococcus sp. B50]MBS9376450.1 hypothetical protein [Rhodococcus sp. B50]
MIADEDRPFESSPEGQPHSIDPIAVVANPQVRAVYEHLVSVARPVTRDEVSTQVKINRSTAASHLDRLAAAGLLSVSFARPPGRGGPGAGRPTKHYAANDVELQVNVPPRRYEFLADILAEATADSDDDRLIRRSGEIAFARGHQHASQFSCTREDPLVFLSETLSHLGYMAHHNGNSRIQLGNCPFRRVSESSPEVVCTLNERYVAGFIAGSGLRDALRVVGDGVAPSCCVTVTLRSPPDGPDPSTVESATTG